MSKRRSATSFTPAEQIDAFRERVMKIRTHPLFQTAEYSFSFRMRYLAAQAQWEMAMPMGSEEQHFYLGSLVRPLLANDDMVCLDKMFGVFGRLCTDELLRHAMKDLRRDYQRRKNGLLFARTTAWRKGEQPGKWITDRQIGEAVLYGRVLHTAPEHRRLLTSLEGPGGSGADEHQALMRLFHEVGTTAMRIDDVLGLALEQGALKL